MSVRERPIDRARRQALDARRSAASELRLAPTNAGLSQAEVARAAGTSHARIGRLERAAIRDLPVPLLLDVAAVLGLEYVGRFFPAGDPIRDAAQIVLLGRFERRLHLSLRLWREVPLPISGALLTALSEGRAPGGGGLLLL